MALSEKERSALQEFKAGVSQSINDKLKYMRLFGSKARNDGTADSDIDVLVAVSEKNRLIENAILDKAFEINMQYDLYISPRIIPVSLFDDPLFTITPFCKNLEREAVTL